MLLGVDVGGTFTDAVLIDDRGAVHTAKVPSTPSRQSRGVLAAIELVLARAGARAAQVDRFAHGMTVATNALLEGHVARTALIATDGFTDLIELGRQARPSLYELWRSAPAPLVPIELRFAAAERMGVAGPLLALDPAAAEAIVESVAAAEPRAVAVALLHSYAHPQHELQLGALLAERLPDVHVSLSSQLVGTFREFERTATTVLDAALSPLLGSYLRQLACHARRIGLVEPRVMQSSGGLTGVERASSHAALTVLSGPAGGVGGALLLAGLADLRSVLCFDMGGTSCDVCVIEHGSVAETAERTIAGRPLALSTLDIHTVGAGGGSIAWRDAGGALRVGPQSAGADPGPACYPHASRADDSDPAQPTVTDANLLLGRLLHDAPLAGGVLLDHAAAEAAVGRLADELGLELMVCAEGIVRVAEAEMLGALRLMSIERGLDPRDFALMAFGGAGPLHALALARQLRIAHVLCPRASGVLCALGLAAAAPRHDIARSILLAGSNFTNERLRQERDELLAQASSALGLEPARARVRYELRYRGQSFELPVEEDVDPASPTQASHTTPAAGLNPAQLRDSFARAHEQRYGYSERDAEVELVTLRASVWGPAPALVPRAEHVGGAPTDVRPVIIHGQSVTATVWHGEPAPGTRIVGPALCALPDATLLVNPGWSGDVDEFGTIHLHDRLQA